MRASAAASMRWWVSALYGQLTETTSLVANSSSSSSRSASSRPLELGRDGTAVVVHDLHAERPWPAPPAPGRSPPIPMMPSWRPWMPVPSIMNIPHCPRLTGPDQPLALGHPPCDHQDQGHRQVGGGVGQHAGRVGHDHAARRAGGDVDVVEPDRDVGDDLRLGAASRKALVDLVRQQRHRRSRQSRVARCGRRRSDRVVVRPTPTRRRACAAPRARSSGIRPSTTIRAGASRRRHPFARAGRCPRLMSSAEIPEYARRTYCSVSPGWALPKWWRVQNETPVSCSAAVGELGDVGEARARPSPR